MNIVALRRGVISGLGALVVFAWVAGCGPVDALKHGIERSDRAANDIKAFVGTKPELSFRYVNFRLDVVNVTFPRPLDTADLPGLSLRIARIVEARFEERPKMMIVGFRVSSD